MLTVPQKRTGVTVQGVVQEAEIATGTVWKGEMSLPVHGRPCAGTPQATLNGYTGHQDRAADMAAPIRLVVLQFSLK